MNNLYKKYCRKDRYVGDIEFKGIGQPIKSPAKFLFDSQVPISVTIRADDVVFDTVYIRCVLIVDKNDC